MAKKPKKEPLTRREKIRFILAGLLLLLFLVATAFVWIYKDRISKNAYTLSVNETAASRTYHYEPDLGQDFAVLGNCLICASESGYQLLSKDGLEISSHDVPIENAAVSSCDQYAAVYGFDSDRVYFVSPNGSEQEYKLSGNLLSLSISDNGFCSIVSREDGYCALVTILDSKHKEIYQWFSGSSYVLNAKVSPDSEKFAALCINTDGSEIRIYSLEQENPLASFSVSNTILVDFFWLSNDRLCTFDTNRAMFFTSDGIWNETYDFNGLHLIAGAASDNGYISFVLSPYKSASTFTLLTLGSTGNQLGSYEYNTEFLTMDCQNNEVLVLTSKSALLFSSSCSLKSALLDVSGYKSAKIISRSKILLISNGFAEAFKL